MCLRVSQLTPHSKSPFRYKILQKLNGSLWSIYKPTRWFDNSITAEFETVFDEYELGDESSFGGIHVFQTLKDARRALEKCRVDNYERVIVRVRVSGFIGAGFYTKRFSNWAIGWRGDLWKKARIVKVYD